MSGIRIEFNTDNEAFTDPNAGIEIARILRELADRFDDCDGNTFELANASIVDINGNRVGAVTITGWH